MRKNILVSVALMTLVIAPMQSVSALTVTTSGGTTSGTSSTTTTNTSGGVSTSSSYKGVPQATGNTNTSGGIGTSTGTSTTTNTSGGISTSGSTSGSTNNTSGGVSTTSSGYKGVPGASGSTNTNTSTGVSTTDDDYKGVPGSTSSGSGSRSGSSGSRSSCNGMNYPDDIDGHWAEIYIRRLYDLCIVEGYTNGTFRPNQKITRAELTKMALYSKGIKPNSGCYDNDCGSPFNDLDSWQGKWIRPAWDRDIVEGFGHNKFKPNQNITRAEAVKIILATYGEDPTSVSKSFFRDVNGWSTGWIERAHKIGLVQGVGNGNFDPNRAITRAEAAKIIALMMEQWDTEIR